MIGVKVVNGADDEEGKEEVDAGSDAVVDVLLVVVGFCVVVVVVLVVVVVVDVEVVGLIRHSPDLNSHSCSGQESHLNLQSLP